MSTAATPEPLPPKRSWWRLHLSTWIVLLLLAVVMTLIIVPGDTQHGWPWVFLKQEASIETQLLKGPPWRSLANWNLFRQWRDYNTLNLVLDSGVALVLLLACGLMFECWRRRRHRVSQFSLRELFVATTLVAIACSWWAWRHHQWQREMDFQRLLRERFKAGSDMDYQGPVWLAKLFGTDNLQWLNGTVDVIFYLPMTENSTDEAMQSLARQMVSMPYLELVATTGADDAVVASLSTVPQLSMLALSESRITDASVKDIQQLVNLRVLLISGKQLKISNAAVGRLESLQNLERLHLRSPLFDDEVIPALARLRQLRRLDLTFTRVTPKGIKELQKQLPECQITEPDLPEEPKGDLPPPR